MSKEGALAMISGQEATPVQPLESVPSEAVVGTKLDSDRFAKLAAKEIQLQKDRESFKSEQQKIYEEKEKLRAVQKQITDFEEMRTKDPIQALKVLGFTDTDIFNALSVEKKDPTPEEIARSAAQEELKKYQDSQAKEAEKAQAERDSKAITEFKGQIGKFIEKDADKLEYCKHYGPVAEDLIYETILSFMRDDQTLTPFDALKEAAEAVETLYEEEDVALMGLKKRQAKNAPKEEPAPAPKPSRTQRPLPTLNNKMTATSASVAKAETKPSGETREQKRERLENMLRQGFTKKN